MTSNRKLRENEELTSWPTFDPAQPMIELDRDIINTNHLSMVQEYLAKKSGL